MEAGGLSAIDWAAPWFAPYAGVGARVEARWRHEALHDALNAGWATFCPPSVAFAPQSAQPEGEPYESFIFRTGTCPTRENLHDFLNGLCWIAFPQAKRALNRLQAAEIERNGTQGPRGAVRDAITVFDENGAILEAPPELWEALIAREWRRLFVDLRPMWGEARLVIFGHALLEQLVRPRKPLTAHVWRADIGSDEALAAGLSAVALAAKPFTPLPVLGIPGWWPENQNFSFYDDSHVFRPAARHKQP